MSAGPHLIGRDLEVAEIAAIIAATGEGRSTALVVHGEAGVGKSTLVHHALEVAASGCRTEYILAAESEAELPYAGLHQLCVGMLSLLDRLPAPQAEALGIALGLRAAASAPSPYLVGLAVTSLLTEAAHERPVVCVVDDAQWLDEASRDALAFAARRLGVESVVLIIVMRELDERFAALQRLAVTGLSDRHAEALLGESALMPSDPRVRSQLLTEARGNPLALQALSQRQLTGEAAGGYALGGGGSLTQRIEDSFLVELGPLTAPARLFLLLAAADPTGDPALLRRAREHLDLGQVVVDEIERSGLLTFGARVMFRHPLVRSSIYRNGSIEDRRAVHRALADATEDADLDRRAWHAAFAAAEPHEPTATALEESAGRARARGGEAAAGAFLERAAQLSPSPADRARRLLLAAEAKVNAAASHEASSLLDMIETDYLSRRDLAIRDWIALRAEYLAHHDPSRTCIGFASVGRRLLATDPALARQVFDMAMYLSVFAAGIGNRTRTGSDPQLHKTVAAAVLDALPDEQPGEDPVDALLRGQALHAVGRRDEGEVAMRRALRLLVDDCDHIRSVSGLASHAALDLWDADAVRALTAAQVEELRRRGELDRFPNALSFRGAVEILDGRLDRSDALSDEIEFVKDALGHPFRRYNRLVTLAWRGEAEPARRLAAELQDGAADRSDASALSCAHYALAILGNGLGRYADAIQAGLQELPALRELSYGKLVVNELLEAAALSGERAIAEQALEELTWLAAPLTESDWAQAALAKGRALLASDDEADALYRESIMRYDRIAMPLEAARARLNHGEWLRRMRRRSEARDTLQVAHAELSARGAAGFAARAAHELAATGAVAPPAVGRPRADLTAQERAIAQLAREGYTNHEIAGRMFLSVRTVEYHLRKVFQKLDIASRHDLDGALGTQP